ncbi:ABC transporter substrate-binding protein [Streptococcus constellatus subsp. pharyngis]|uniref:ABC-type sugar transport system, periplasmic component n=1 Tax=Streptococcus constellatus subsp. pharyngis SK1060 = CCUG 46377 TaxID=1035184 RepID=U2ZMX2_STRCV|nr:ABC transporter substrate-binding protein [Streptococcus constellatus]AGU71977.1 sugar ABC transporter, sugar-binding protein [Streptococcus constellatus subsp. pharyngis C232]AGU73733.1 sugar ABC transporter, sugar-binding protein [Streptococcus constellatus subsp. pharyngis C818]AGU79101.1 sugar ABC transporter, sugar-binding protein [Streptococcus constellatus subsp. pharyngis C1050]QQC22336.1 carbohydrate ABC transporter substrate-binding protein [Streptococcus constellatus]QRP81362.1 c
MRMKKILCSLVAGAAILSLAACGNSGGSNKSADSGNSSGKTEITWWAFPVFTQEKANDGVGTYEKEIIKAFEKANPDIKVKLETIDFKSGPEKITTAIEAGTAPDVLFDAPGRIIQYGKNGKLAELNDLFTNDFVKDVNNNQIIQASKAGDKAYMYPISSAPFYMALNKKMLKEAGVEDLVKEGWTTADFEKVLKALKEKGYTPGSLFSNGQGGDQGTRAFIANLYNGSVTDDKVTKYTTDSPNFVKGLNKAVSWIKDGLMTNGSQFDGGADIQNFANGQTSYTVLWAPAQKGIQAKLLKASGVEVVEVPFPSDNGKPALEYLVNGFGIFNNKDKKKVEAAKKFVKFIADDKKWGPKNVVRTGAFPVRSSFGKLYNDKRMETISTWTKYYSPYYNTIDGFAEMRTLWFPMLQSVSNGDEKVESALKTFTEKANETIKKSKK